MKSKINTVWIPVINLPKELVLYIYIYTYMSSWKGEKEAIERVERRKQLGLDVCTRMIRGWSLLLTELWDLER
jgi:hypothetical protein